MSVKGTSLDAPCNITSADATAYVRYRGNIGTSDTCCCSRGKYYTTDAKYRIFIETKTDTIMKW